MTDPGIRPGWPDTRLEVSLLDGAAGLVACDEVGRGALAGPVAVGAVYVTRADIDAGLPPTIRDSKLIPEARRQFVAEEAARWVSGSAVGWASAEEIDRRGIVAALGMAAARAVRQLGVPDPLILLDGDRDYISAAFDAPCTVRPVVRGDRTSGAIAAASVLAKVARDEIMAELDARYPEYLWKRNKGYGSPDHRRAIEAFGLSPHHRASWRLTPQPLF